MINQPIFFERNRTGRVYIGGKLFAPFFGDEPIDGYKPEEWIASSVKAINKGSTIYKEGVSKVKNTEIFFDELLKEHPAELLGEGKNLRILVKALDSAIRLPAQAHPDKAFSEKHFGSSYGKTECWIILDKRENAKIFFGFKDGVSKENFEKAIDDSEHDMDAMERLMKEITPEIGECYFVPAKTVHAIGKGCLILEVQEPTDFTIQPERFCGEYKLSDEEMYLGLTREDAVSCFDFCKAPNAKIAPRVVIDTPEYKKEILIDKENTDCFVINRHTLSGGEFLMDIENSYSIYIVTDGEGFILGDGYKKAIKKGDYFFLPAKAQGKFTVSGDLQVAECY